MEAVQQHKETPRSLTIERGKQSWRHIRDTERINKNHWLDIGSALLVGREQNRQTQEFGKWCAQHFPGLSRARRADAIWAAENEAMYRSVQHTNPSDARQAHRELEVERELAERERKIQEAAAAEAAEKEEARRRVDADTQKIREGNDEDADDDDEEATEDEGHTVWLFGDPTPPAIAATKVADRAEWCPEFAEAVRHFRAHEQKITRYIKKTDMEAAQQHYRAAKQHLEMITRTLFAAAGLGEWKVENFAEFYRFGGEQL